MSRKATYTRKGVPALLTYKRQQQEENRTAVIDALLMLGTASTREIQDYLIRELWLRDNNKIKKRAQQRTLLNKARIPESEYLKLVSRTIDVRTIQRRLRELKKEGVVGIDEKDGLYRLTEYARTNLKLFGTRFGSIALAEIMDLHYPGLNPLEFNVEELIKIFGVYILYCLTEGARPVAHTGVHDNVNRRGRYSLNKPIVDILARDRLALNWIKDVISSRHMFDYFLAALKYYEDNKGYDMRNMVKQPIEDQGGGRFTVMIRDSHGNFERPKSSQTLMGERFFLITSKGSDYIAKTKGKPFYELSADTIKGITRILKERYGIYYEALHEARSSFLGKPKEMSSGTAIAQTGQRENKSRILKYDREVDEI